MEMEIELLEPEAKAIEQTTALSVRDAAALAMASSKTRSDLIALAKKSKAITEIKNKAGRDECHSAAMKAADARIAIAKTGKAARDDATKFSKAVIAEEKSLIALIEPEETRLLALRDAWDAKIAAEKAERERIERERVLAITQRIADIRGYHALALECRTADRVQGLIDKLQAVEVAPDEFEEFAEEAIAAKTGTLAAMAAIHGRKVEEEAERARIKAEQEEAAARLAAERAELQRQREAFEAEQAAVRAQQQAEAERLAAQAADLERNAQAAKFASMTHPNGAPMFSTTVFKENGAPIMLDANGKRSVFCDIDEGESDVVDAEITNADPLPFIAPAPHVALMSADTCDEAAPTDEDVIAVAARALCDAFGWSYEYAIDRLSAIQEWTTT